MQDTKLYEGSNPLSGLVANFLYLPITEDRTLIGLTVKVDENVATNPAVFVVNKNGSPLDVGDVEIAIGDQFVTVGFAEIELLKDDEITLTLSSGTVIAPLALSLEFKNVFTTPVFVPDDPYDETDWNANLEVPTKNSLRDEIVALYAYVVAAISAAITGLWKDRGNYDASSNLFPSTGGSGSAGAVKKGDTWIISVAGTLGGHAVNLGDTVRALVDTPGQTDANWAILENNLGYTPENAANKSTDGTFANNSDTEYPSQKAAKSYVDTIAASFNNSTGTALTRLLTGGQVSRTTDYDYEVTAATFLLNGDYYETPESIVSLDGADVSDDRFDLIVLTSTPAADKVTGTPDANPSTPDIDPATQLLLSTVLVSAGTTEPTDAVAPEVVFKEHTGGEYTVTVGAGWNADYAVGPRTGSKCLRANSVASNTGAVFTRATPTDLVGYNALRLYILSDGDIGNNKFIRIQCRLAGVVKGTTLIIGQNTPSSFGYDSTNHLTYQLVLIPLDYFVLPAGGMIDEFRIFTSGASLSFRVDDVELVNTNTTVISNTSGFTQEQGDARYLQQALSNYTSKTTPIGADSTFIFDSVTNLWKLLTFTNLLVYLKAYFDGIYASVTGGSETTTTLGALVNSAGAATPNDSDLVATAESGGLLQKITWTAIKTFLANHFATRTYAESLVVGLWDDRGSFDASGGAYPSSGGSGTAGAILKGDIWTISVAGTLPTGQAVNIGDVVRALVDTPGNTQANWAITENNLGYTAENSANKSTDVATDQASNTKYPSVKAVYDWAVALFITATQTVTLTNKRITSRVGTTASSATPTPDADAHDVYTVTALAAGATFGAPSGTPTDGQPLIIRIKDNGTARTLAFNAIYRAVGVTLPTTTVISKTIYLGLIYNNADSKWDVVAYCLQA